MARFAGAANLRQDVVIEPMTTLANRPTTALLVIDMQNGAVADAHKGDTVVANIAGLIEKARVREYLSSGFITPTTRIQPRPNGSDGIDIDTIANDSTDYEQHDREQGRVACAKAP